MPHRRYRIRRAEPEEVAAILLAAVTVERRPAPRPAEVARFVLDVLIASATGVVGLIAAMAGLGWLL